MDTKFIQVGFGSRKRHAIVCGHHNERIFQESFSFQQTEHSLQVLIKPLNFNSIVEQVRTNGRVVGKKGRHLCTFKTFASSQACSIFVSAVRLMGPKPEEEWLFRRLFLEEFLEITSIIPATDALGRLHVVAIVSFANGVL